MSLRITNTLTGKKEDFHPLIPGEVKIYTCGPTVYGLTHIGNARPAVFFDVVRRFFEYTGAKVTWVMNYTDVDDKIINRAREEGTSSQVIAERFTKEYLADLSSLSVRLPTIQPKVTETIPQILALIERLIQTGCAYVAPDGEVFFSVRNFPQYGKLSGKKIDDLLVGVRIQADEKKRDPLDFSLWKPRKAEDEPAWKSPWGMGRPGWHIECSAMATHYLGDTFDIHGGGLDLIHPHHENEIAQSEGATGKQFARYWLHNNLISIQKEKMSKSVGNIFLTRDFVAKHTAEALRYLLLSVHYRSPVEFSPEHISEIQASLHRVYSAKKKALAFATLAAGARQPESSLEKNVRELGERFEPGWRDSLLDDFNLPKAVALVFDYVRALNAYLGKKGFKPTAETPRLAQEFLENLHRFSEVVGVFGLEPATYLAQLRSAVLADRNQDAVWVDTRVKERQVARAEKNFAKSDAIRDELLKAGIEIQDTPQGSEWDVVFSCVDSPSKSST